MPWHVLAFRIALISVACWAWWRGGAPERTAATLFVVAAVLSRLLKPTAEMPFGTIRLGVAAVDLALLIALLVLFYRANRIWPAWCVALHLVTTLAHLVRIIDPSLVRAAYMLLTIYSAWGTVIVLAVATWRHRRRLILTGADPSWATSSHAFLKGRRSPPP